MGDAEFYANIESRCVPFLHTASVIKQYGITRATHATMEAVGKMEFAFLRDYVLGPFERTSHWDTTAGGRVLDCWIDELNRLKGTKTHWTPVSCCFVQQWSGVRGRDGASEKPERICRGGGMNKCELGSQIKLGYYSLWKAYFCAFYCSLYMEFCPFQVLARPFIWAAPRLLPLPKQFDLLFQRYHKAQCLKCRTAPKETLLCLVCGDVVCFRDSCCMSNSLTEVETHAVDCGAGTGVYLSVQTSTIIITRDKRAGHWGSLYLDAHGEEDRGLK